MWLDSFCRPGKADFLVGGQWGSEGKGAAAAYLAKALVELGAQRHMYDIVTTNAGAQAGHTSTHNGKTRVAFHLPTAALIAQDYGIRPLVYLNAGSIIDPQVLEDELRDAGFTPGQFVIHPNAAIITDGCRAAEGDRQSAQTKIASTRKGVGEALARKVLRYGLTAKDHPFTKQFVSREFSLSHALKNGASVLVEVPQGIGLSIDGPFYPHCTSRNCTVMQAMSDAGIHPSFYGASMLVLRTYPIRVGNIVEAGQELGQSGGHYPDQREISWNELGVRPEITTVTKRVRRVFTFSVDQMRDAMALTRPDVVCLTFCDYPGANRSGITEQIHYAAASVGMKGPPTVLYQAGPTTDDVSDYLYAIGGEPQL